MPEKIQWKKVSMWDQQLENFSCHKSREVAGSTKVVGVHSLILIVTNWNPDYSIFYDLVGYKICVVRFGFIPNKNGRQEHSEVSSEENKPR